MSTYGLDEEADVGSVSSEKSKTRFNESLNTTYEYVPYISTEEEEEDIAADPKPVDVGRIVLDTEQDYSFSDSQSVDGHVRMHTRPGPGAQRQNDLLDQHRRFDRRVLGTSMRDETTKPNVLNASIMTALQAHLPYSKRDELFWIKYSLVRDGASMSTLLNKTQGAEYTILAVETLDGEVFGAFTAQPWHITWKYYGTTESFLWRLKNRRLPNRRIADENGRSEPEHNEMDVFRFAGNNRNVQLCNNERMAVGGGYPDDSESVCQNDELLSTVKLTDWGFGLAFGNDMQQGSSSACITFESPPLSKLHADGSLFEVANMEIWTLTPCLSMQEAERMEQSKLVLQRCMTA